MASLEEPNEAAQETFDRIIERSRAAKREKDEKELRGLIIEFLKDLMYVGLLLYWIFGQPQMTGAEFICSEWLVFVGAWTVTIFVGHFGSIIAMPWIYRWVEREVDEMLEGASDD